jgi:WhiB family redox-sensing transcriptional regulator
MAHNTSRATVRGYTPAKGPDAQPKREKAKPRGRRPVERQGSWTDRAACLNADPELFFTIEGEPRAEKDARTKKAKQVCMGCPVRTDCLSWALGTPEKYGVWGGLDEDERSSERRRRMRRDAAARARTATQQPPAAREDDRAGEAAHAACG